MTAKKPKLCKCAEEVDAQLKPVGFKLTRHMTINFATGQGSRSGPVLQTEKCDKTKRGRRAPVLLCAYCPFCGRKTE